MDLGNVAVASAGREYVRVGESLPIPGEVDWSVAPSQFKRYRGVPRLPLEYESPGSSSEERTSSRHLSAGQLGQLLSDAYGLTRQRWTAPDALRWIVGTRGAETISRYRGLASNTLRPVPSGGARFPAELYVVSGPGDGIPSGVHHYDSAHHALDTLRSGDWRPELATGMGYRAGEVPPLTILVSINFWKNAFKYGELSYRLCSLDAGALIGQILAVAGRYTLLAAVRYQFVDSELDRLLHLDPSRESVYAAITIGETVGDTEPGLNGETSRRTFYQKLDTPEPEGAWTIDELPLPARLHRASRISSTDEFYPGQRLEEFSVAPVQSQRTILLPQRGLDLLDGLRHRRSSMGYFSLSQVSLQQLAELFGAAAEGYVSDIDGEPPAIRHTLLFCAINNVEGVEPGVYFYDPALHALEQVRAGDIRAELQASLVGKLFNLTHSGLCIYPVGDYQRGFEVYGDRWYRIQNMEAGIMLQRLYLAAAGCGLGSHANLGYNVGRTNRLLGLEAGRLTSLIQLMIGTPREPGDHYEYPCW